MILNRADVPVVYRGMAIHNTEREATAIAEHLTHKEGGEYRVMELTQVCKFKTNVVKESAQ